MNIWAKIQAVTTWIWDFFKPVFNIMIKQAGQVLMATALEVVTSIAKDPSLMSKDGEEKRKIALKLITDQLVSEGVNIGTSAVNLAIEMAVAKINEK